MVASSSRDSRGADRIVSDYSLCPSQRTTAPVWQRHQGHIAIGRTLDWLVGRSGTRRWADGIVCGCGVTWLAAGCWLIERLLLTHRGAASVVGGQHTMRRWVMKVTAPMSNSDCDEVCQRIHRHRPSKRSQTLRGLTLAGNFRKTSAPTVDPTPGFNSFPGSRHSGGIRIVSSVARPAECLQPGVTGGRPVANQVGEGPKSALRESPVLFGNLRNGPFWLRKWYRCSL